MTGLTIDAVNPETDIEALVSLNCREVDEWHHYSKDGMQGAPSTWEELSTWERWRHGGPWLDSDLLSLHLKIIEEAGGTVLVARQKGEIIGELEAAYDMQSLEGGRAHIVWMVVDPAWQRKGVGSLLAKQGREIAKKMGCHLLTVSSQDQVSSDFYTSQGFQKTDSLLFFSKELGDEKGAVQIDDVQMLPLEWKQRPQPPIGFRLVIGNNYTPAYTWSYLRHMIELYELMKVDIPPPKLWLLRQNASEAVTVAHKFVRLWHSPQGKETSDFLARALMTTEELSRKNDVSQLNAYTFPSHQRLLETAGFTLRGQEAYHSFPL